MTSAPESAVSDRATRVSVELGGTMRDAAWRPIEVEIGDLSATGFAMRTREMLAVGDVVTVAIGGLGTRAAIVVRAAEGGFGCRFREPLPHDLVVTAEEVASGTVAVLPVASPVLPGADAAAAGGRLPAWVRGAVMLGGAGLLWAAIWAVGRLVG